MKNEKIKSKSDAAGGLIFVGSLMMGIGTGIYYGNTAVGALYGLGVGFILFGLIKILSKK